MEFLKKKEIQKLCVKGLDEYILERNRKRYMEECQRELFVSFHCQQGHTGN